MKFTLKECMCKSDMADDEITPEIVCNARKLIKRVNSLGCPFSRVCVSFLRGKSKQEAIYHNRACLKMPPFTDGNFDMTKVPMKSCHLTGQAIDVWDADGKLKAWIKENLGALERAGLWCEHFDDTPDWVHFQSVPPKSGRRFFSSIKEPARRRVFFMLPLRQVGLKVLRRRRPGISERWQVRDYLCLKTFCTDRDG